MPSLDKRLSHKSSNLSSKIRGSSRLSSLVSFDKPSKQKHSHHRPLSTTSSLSSSVSLSPASSLTLGTSSGFSNISTPTLISSSAKSINGIPLTSRAEAAQAAQAAANGNALIESSSPSLSSKSQFSNQSQSHNSRSDHQINHVTKHPDSATRSPPATRQFSEPQSKLCRIINFVPTPPPSQFSRPDFDQILYTLQHIGLGKDSESFTSFFSFPRSSQSTINLESFISNNRKSPYLPSLSHENNDPPKFDSANSNTKPSTVSGTQNISQGTPKLAEKDEMISLSETLFWALWLIRNVLYSYELAKNDNHNFTSSSQFSSNSKPQLWEHLQTQINDHISLRQEELKLERVKQARKLNAAYSQAMLDGVVRYNEFDANLFSHLFPDQKSSHSSMSLSGSAARTTLHSDSDFSSNTTSANYILSADAAHATSALANNPYASMIPTTHVPDIFNFSSLPRSDSMGVFLTKSLFLPKTLWSSLNLQGISSEMIEQRLECLREFIRLGEAFIAQQLMVRSGLIGLSSWEDVGSSRNKSLLGSSFNHISSSKPDVFVNPVAGVQGPNFGLRSGYDRNLTTSFVTNKTSYLLEKQGPQLANLESEIHMAFISPIDTAAYGREETSSVVTTSGTHMVASASSNLDSLEPVVSHSSSSRSSFISRSRPRSSSGSSSIMTAPSVTNAKSYTVHHSHNASVNNSSGNQKENFSDSGKLSSGGINTLHFLDKIHKLKIENAKNSSDLSLLSNVARRATYFANPSAFPTNTSSNMSTSRKSIKRRLSISNSKENLSNEKRDLPVSVGRGASTSHPVKEGTEKSLKSRKNSTEASSRPDRKEYSFFNESLKPTTSNMSISSIKTTSSNTSLRSGLSFSNNFSHVKNHGYGPAMITNRDFERAHHLSAPVAESRKKEKGFSKIFRTSRLSLGSSSNNTSSPSMITSDDHNNQNNHQHNYRSRISMGGGTIKGVYGSKNSKAEMITSQDIQRQHESGQQINKVQDTFKGSENPINSSSKPIEAQSDHIDPVTSTGTTLVPKNSKYIQTTGPDDLAHILSTVSISSSSPSSSSFLSSLDTGKTNINNEVITASGDLNKFQHRHRHNVSTSSTSSTISITSVGSERSTVSSKSMVLTYSNNPMISTTTDSSYTSDGFGKEDEDLNRPSNIDNIDKKLNINTKFSMESLGPSTVTAKDTKWTYFGRPVSAESKHVNMASLDLTSPKQISQGLGDVNGNLTKELDKKGGNSQLKNSPSSPLKLRPRALASGLPMRGVPRNPGTRTSTVRQGSHHVSGFGNRTATQNQEIRQLEFFASREPGFRTKCFMLSGVGDRVSKSACTETAFGILESYNDCISRPDTVAATKYGYVLKRKEITNEKHSSVLESPTDMKRYGSFTSSTTTTRDEYGSPMKPTIHTYLEVLSHLKDVLTQILGKEEVSRLFEAEFAKATGSECKTEAESKENTVQASELHENVKSRDVNNDEAEIRQRQKKFSSSQEDLNLSGSCLENQGGSYNVNNEQSASMHLHQPTSSDHNKIGVAISSPPESVGSAITTSTSPTSTTSSHGLNSRRHHKGLVRKQTQHNLHVHAPKNNNVQPSSISPRKRRPNSQQHQDTQPDRFSLLSDDKVKSRPNPELLHFGLDTDDIKGLSPNSSFAGNFGDLTNNSELLEPTKTTKYNIKDSNCRENNTSGQSNCSSPLGRSSISQQHQVSEHSSNSTSFKTEQKQQRQTKAINSKPEPCVITDLELQELEMSEEWAHAYAVFAAKVVARVLLKDISCLIMMYQSYIRDWILE